MGDKPPAPEAYRRNLRRIRELKGLTQTEAAERMGTSRSLYAKLEEGTRRLHTGWIDKAAFAFDIDPGDLFRTSRPRRSSCGEIADHGHVRLSRQPACEDSRTEYLINKGSWFGTYLVNWWVNFRKFDNAAANLIDGNIYIIMLRDQLMVRQIWRGPFGKCRRYHLISPSAAPSFDMEVTILFDVIGLER